MERRAWLQYRLAVLLICALAFAANGVNAQVPAAAPVAPPNQVSAQTLPPQQLDNLVAPIALYPDPLLGQMLAAATYPVELVEAEQWLLANPNLSGQQLADAARQQNWDPSVQALVVVPDALRLLTQDIHWTTDLGNAFLAQQGDVMGAVQRMRQRAQANGQLRSTPQETVTDQDQGGQNAIEIQPADPQVVYVPAYDPYYVWGWGDYPSLYYPDGYWFEPGINIGLCFGGWGGWGYGGWGWGWGVNWFGGNIFVNNLFFNRYGYHYGYGFAGGLQGRTPWNHDPSHRAGALYPTGRLSNRFGAASQASRLAEGNSGNWHSFNGNNAGNRGSFLGTGPRAGTEYGRGYQSLGTRSGGASRNFESPAQRPGVASPRYQSPERGFQTPERSFQAPQRSFQAPSYQAPQRSFQSVPRSYSPSSGGGGSRSFGGGGGGFRSSGGGARSSGGGGGHGGRR